jgi:hypothetical protein
VPAQPALALFRWNVLLSGSDPIGIYGNLAEEMNLFFYDN